MNDYMIPTGKEITYQVKSPEIISYTEPRLISQNK